MAINATETDLLVGCLTIWGEARGCSQAGREAVASAILNRCLARQWYGRGVAGHIDHSIGAVCLKAMQFSCWNAGDPNAKLLTNMRKDYKIAIRSKDFRSCVKALIDTLDGYTRDRTNGATHYYAPKSVPEPNWAKGKTFVSVDDHRFYSGIA